MRAAASVYARPLARLARQTACRFPFVRAAEWGRAKRRRLRHLCRASRRSKSLHIDTSCRRACLHNGAAHCVSLDVPCALTRSRFAFAPQGRIFSAPCPWRQVLVRAIARCPWQRLASFAHPGGGPHFHLHEMIVSASLGARVPPATLLRLCVWPSVYHYWRGGNVTARGARADSLSQRQRPARCTNALEEALSSIDVKFRRLTSVVELFDGKQLKSSVTIVSAVI